jgi:hypothetical protein
MAVKRWVVRVVEFTSTDPLKDPHRQTLSGLWLEQLRRLDLIHWIIQDEMVTIDGKEMFKQVFDIYCPQRISTQETKFWAERHAERMQSFGLSAVAAPEWKAGDARPS